MGSFFGKKTWVALLAVLALAATAVLASGLRQLSFRGAQILGQGQDQAGLPELPVSSILRDLADTPIWRQMLVWAVLFVIVLIISLVFSPELRRWLIRIFLQLMTTALVIFLLAKRFSDLSAQQEMFDTSGGPGSAPPLQAQPLPAFQPPHLSPAFVFLASLAAAALLGAGLWAAQRWWERRQRALALRKPVDQLADIARDSLQRIASGGSWDDAIMDSYARMSLVVEQRRGLVRQQAMTPSEFAVRLEGAGLPADAVHTLTRLFEKVRYGDRKPSPEETGEAIRCLTAIVDYCGGAR